MVMSEKNWADYNPSGNWKRSENAVSNPINVQNPSHTQSVDIVSPGSRSLVLSTVDQVLGSSPSSVVKNSTMQRHERKHSPTKTVMDDRSDAASHGSAQSAEQPIPGAISIPQPYEIPTPLGTTPDMSVPLQFMPPFLYQESNRFGAPNGGYGVGSWGAVYNYPSEYGQTPPTSIFPSTPPMPYQLSQTSYVPSPLTNNFSSLSISGPQGRLRRDSFNANIPPPSIARNVTTYTAPTPIPAPPTSQYFLVSPPGSFGSSPTIFYQFPSMAQAPPPAPIAPPSNVPVYTPQNGPRTVFTNQPTPIHGYTSNGTPANANVAHNNRRNQQTQQHSRVTAANSSSSEKSSNTPHRSQQLDDFRNSRLPHLQLSDLGSNVVEFAKDQHGSRFIQQKLERTSNKEKQMVFDEVIKHGQILMTDVFGNYVIQKFFEFGTPEQKNQLVDAIRGNVMNLALQMYGCRVIQKALESISPEQQMDLLTEMKGQVLKCVKDQNGNHVVQKVIERVDPTKLQFIIDSFTSSPNDTVSSLAKHPYGCRVIQRVLEHCTFEQKQTVLEELHKNIKDLISDQYGNYVIQHVIEHGSVEDRDRIVNEIRGDVLKHAQHKFASNVIEKCLTYGNLDQKSILIIEVCGDGTRPTQLMDMMKDPFANYVVQKMLDVADSNLRKKMLVSMKPYISQLRRASYGKHIIAKLEKYFQKSAVAPGQTFADFTGTASVNSQVNSGIFSGIDYSAVNQHSSLFS